MAFHTLSIGTSALITARYGLDVTGQNLGNVDTNGYSRQRLTQSSTQAWKMGQTVLGNGVHPTSITRIANEYMEKQLRQAISTDEYFGNLQNGYTNLQTFFNELSYVELGAANGLSDSMNDFWKSMNELSANVENLSIRSTIVNDAQKMVTRFNTLGNQLDKYKSDTDAQVADSVNQINRILNTIADLNKAIVTTELGGASDRSANDLRDQRGEVVKELYEYIDADVVEESNGSFIISIHGRNLVYYDQVKTIANQKTLSPDGTMVNTPVFSSDNYPLSPKDGQLAALMELRDTIIPSYKSDLDNLAANFIWEFNRIYSQTRGLESYSSLKALNKPVDPSVTLNQLQFVGGAVGGTFEIVNGNFEIIVHNRNSDQPTTVNIEIDLDGRPGPDGQPDMILWDPDNPDAGHSLVNRIQAELDAKVPGAFEVTIDRYYQISITAKSDDYGFCFGKDTSGVVAALGMNVFFTGFDSTTMGVNGDLKDNPSLMGGSYSFLGGDNEGILDLLALQDKALGNLNNLTLGTYYQAVLGRLGSEAASVSNLRDLSSDVMVSMFNQRESLSGVNEEEEVAKLITYQRAFQSAAKFISVVDELYETLIHM